jgi:3-mercaptopyruvate sulfurtransferase SseA
MNKSRRSGFLVDGDWLEQHLDDPGIRIVEVSDYNEEQEANSRSISRARFTDPGKMSCGTPQTGISPHLKALPS